MLCCVCEFRYKEGTLTDSTVLQFHVCMKFILTCEWIYFSLQHRANRSLATKAATAAAAAAAE
jgi:hypothetical protein